MVQGGSSCFRSFGTRRCGRCWILAWGLSRKASRGPGPYPAFVAKGPGFQIYRKAGKLQKLGGLGRLMVCAMPKQPNGTPGKKPPAPSVKKGPPAMPLS